MGHAALDPEGIGRGRGHDGASSGRDHCPRRLLHAEKRSRQIDVDDATPARLVDLLERLPIGDTGVGGQDIEPAKALQAALDSAPHVELMGDITIDCLGDPSSGTKLGGGLFGQVALDVKEEDARALAVRRLRDRPPIPCAAPVTSADLPANRPSVISSATPVDAINPLDGLAPEPGSPVTRPRA